jgi:hypothetical protein
MSTAANTNAIAISEDGTREKNASNNGAYVNGARETYLVKDAAVIWRNTMFIEK